MNLFKFKKAITKHLRSAEKMFWHLCHRYVYFVDSNWPDNFYLSNESIFVLLNPIDFCTLKDPNIKEALSFYQALWEYTEDLRVIIEDLR